MRAAALIALLIGATACASRATPPRAVAAETGGEPEARRLAATAQVHFDLGEYRAAAADLRASYRHHASPGLLFNLGQAHRLAGDCVDATAAYRAFLRAAPTSPYRPTVTRHLEALHTCAVEQAVDHEQAARPARRRRLTGAIVGAGGVILLAAGALVSADGMATAPGEESTVPALGAALLSGGGAALGVGATLYFASWRF